jgi:hypothetical protein
VGIPLEVGCDVDAEVLRVIHALELVPMKGVGFYQGGTSPSHVDGVAFLRMEAHLPLLLPGCQLVQIFLELLLVFFGGDVGLAHGGIYKEAHSGGQVDG